MRPDTLDPGTSVRFRCNVCGQENEEDAARFHRELAPCSTCGSNVRFRGIIHALTSGLYGESRILREIPEDEPFAGLGFSDAACYARLLETRFAYLNTQLDVAPMLDIGRAEDAERYMPVDFVICSDVFEHVAPPVERAFRNLAALLRPDGLLVFSVPSFDMPRTVEHYPRYHDARIVELASGRVLVNRTTDGEVETFEDLVFHGGPGSTLEMRVFSEADILGSLRGAGFDRVQVFDSAVPEFGYYWPQSSAERFRGAEPCGYVISARRAVAADMPA